MKTLPHQTKFLSVFATFLFTAISYSQVTRVVYKKNIYGGDLSNPQIPTTGDTYKNLTPEMRKQVEDMLKSEARVELELLYDKKTAIYRKVEGLGTGENEVADKMQDIFNSTKYYINLKTKEKLSQNTDPRMGKLYNVIVPTDEYKWEITSETKIIDGHKCYKANTTKQVGYNPWKKNSTTQSITAWFTPEIPTSFGPQGLDGLPGLVLEASFGGKKYLYAAKIEFDVKKIKIERPAGGTNITEKEQEAMIMENYKVMQGN